MKKQIIGFITVLVLSMVFSGCVAIVGIPIVDVDPPDVPPTPVSLPPFVENAINNAPDDVLVSIGNAHQESLSQSRIIAANHARAEIARQINTIGQKIVQDFEASNGVSHAVALSFMENITVALTKSDLHDSYIKDEDRADDGAVWNITFMHKDDVKDELSNIVIDAKLAVPAMDSFDIESSFDEIFELVRAQTLEALLQHTS